MFNNFSNFIAVKNKTVIDFKFNKCIFRFFHLHILSNAKAMEDFSLLSFISNLNLMLFEQKFIILKQKMETK